MEILYDTDEKVLTTGTASNLLELCLKHKLEISHSCEGMGSCGTCRVIITSDPKELPPRNSLEMLMAADRSFQPNERLACQTPLTKSLSFRLPGDCLHK